MSEEFGWSTDTEVYYGKFPSREAAVAAALARNPDLGLVYTGRCCYLATPPTGYVDVDYLLDAFRDGSGDGAMIEAAVDWPELTSDQDRALRQEVEAVVLRHLKVAGEWPPAWYTAEDVQDHDLRKVG